MTRRKLPVDAVEMVLVMSWLIDSVVVDSVAVFVTTLMTVFSSIV